MMLNQQMVDAAKAAGWKMFFLPLYSATEHCFHFSHPDGSKRYFQAWRDGPVWLSHSAMARLMDAKR